MANIYDEKITRDTDWGGDSSTGGLPVAGNRVQEFIKDELNSKIAAIYKPEGTPVVYCFATEEDKALFIATGDESYVLESFETESKYEVVLKDFETSISVVVGTTGNTLDYYFRIQDKDYDESEQYISPDAKAKIEYSFTGNGLTKKFTDEVTLSSGDWTRVQVNIDDYLENGTNNISIKITGLTTLASKTVGVTYSLFDLSYVPGFAYDTVQTGNVIYVTYTIEGSETKYIEYYLDGKLVDNIDGEEKSAKVIYNVRESDESVLSISALTAGQHSLQTRAYVKSADGSNFYTSSHFYTFAKGGEANPSFLMYMALDNSQGVVLGDDNLTIKTSQYTQISFNWGIYDYLGRSFKVYFEYDGTTKESDYNIGTGIQEFAFRPMHSGEYPLNIYTNGESGETLFNYEIDFNVEKVSGGIEETTGGLLLKLQSNGRRNTDANKDVWECVGTDGNTYKATFNNFNWSNQQGWDADTESLVISNGATVDFNIQPMINDWAEQGGTIEIDLETFDVDDDDAVICECSDGLEGTASIKITATQALFKTAAGKSIDTRYKDNERLKFAFIGNKNGTAEDDNLIYIVVNGVLERASLYSNDHMISNAYLSIGDPNGLCKVRLRSIRVYKKAITVDEEFNNFVVDSENVEEIYERNNVLKSGTTEIGFDEVVQKIPVMIFTGDMQKMIKEGQSTKTTGIWYPFDVEYINTKEPERNFVAFDAKMKLQGTSSLGYPRKNFKLKTKEKTWNSDYYENFSKVVIDSGSVIGNRMLKNKTTGKVIDFDEIGLLNDMCYTFDYQDVPLKKGKYRFREDSHKADKWTLKADFMESSCSHNVGAGRSWNDIFENAKLATDGYNNHTYQESALVSQKDYITYTKDGVSYKINNNGDEIKRQEDYVCRTNAQKICIAEGQDDVRTAVDGFPMVCFYRTSHKANDLVFMGQYNFINDKSSFEVFGFEDIEDPDDDSTMIYDGTEVECWEGLKNTSPISLFQTIVDWPSSAQGWSSTFESRYPDPDDYGVPGKRWYDASSGNSETLGSPIFELCKWLISTRHDSGGTIYDVSGNVKTITTDTLDIDSTFAERINNYQYGYTEETAESYLYASGTSLQDNAENRQKKFETEKWEHFDVWKLAGYYIYLRRYGAVDQFVKNAMLFTDGNGKYDTRTEDPRYRKWYFINYDNDCLFGLRNNGELAFDWTLDRQTIDGEASGSTEEEYENTYAMMGHDSTLWNNLEADDEFMRMVRDLDNSMASVGLNYDNMVTEFDTNQTEKWCERIYNSNERYKYIDAAKGLGDMSGTCVDNLWMLQGTRRSHRHWWIANHFDLLDAQWLSGNYKNTFMLIKTNCLKGATIHAVAGADYYYAWGQQKKIYESNMVRKEGEDIDFTFDFNQSQGDPVRIYAINKLSEIDLSDIDVARYVFAGSFQFQVNNTEVANTLKKLVIGNENIINTAEITTSTWTAVPNLEYIDITNYNGITSLPLSSFANLKTLKAKGTSLGEFSPANGSTFDLIELPSTVSYLNLSDIKFTSDFLSSFKYTPSVSLSTLILSKNDKSSSVSNWGINSDYYNNIIVPWINAIEASAESSLYYSRASMTISNIHWSFSNLDSIRIFKNFKKYGKKFDMSGEISLLSCGNLTKDNIEEIKSIFGENCFNKYYASVYITTPDSVFIDAKNSEGESVRSMVAGQTQDFEREVYPDEASIASRDPVINFYLVNEVSASTGSDIIYDIVTGKYFKIISDPSTIRTGLTFVQKVINDGKEYGELSSEEIKTGTDSVCTVLVKMTTNNSIQPKVSFLDFTIQDPTYVSKATVNGTVSLYQNKEYTYTVSALTSDNKKAIGTYSITWSLSGDGQNYVESLTPFGDDNSSVKITMKNNYEPEVSEQLYVICTIDNYNGTSVVSSKKALVLNHEVILSVDSNPTVMNICYEKGWASNQYAMTKAEAEAVTNDKLGTAFSNISEEFSFEEFTYFTGITELAASAFSDSNITMIVLPTTLTSIGAYAFADCSALTRVCIDDDSTVETAYIDTLPSAIVEIKEGTFMNCSSLNELQLPDELTIIRNYAFGGTTLKQVLYSSDSLSDHVLLLSPIITKIEGYAFETEAWSRETTTNPLEVLEIPNTLKMTDNYEILYGKYFKEFVADTDSYESVDGVLYDKSHETILRYPPKKDTVVDTYTLQGTSIIAKYAFFAVENLTTIVLSGDIVPNGLGEHAFDSSKIEEFDLSECANLETISDYAFYYCTKMDEILLPQGGSLTTMGIRSFDHCTSLESINLPLSISTYKTDENERSNVFNACGFIELTITDGTKSLPMSLVNNCPNLVKLTLPTYAVINNSYSTVLNCPKLETVVMPLFSYTKKLYQVMSGDTVMGTYETLEEATAAKTADETIRIVDGDSVTVNTTVRHNGTYDLIEKSCSGFTTFELREDDNNNIMQCEDGVLYRDGLGTLYIAPWGISALTINEDVTRIEDYACTYCYYISSIEIPENVFNIGEGAFMNCKALATATMHDKVAIIGANAFDYCDNLSYIYLSKGLISIGRQAFRDTSLTSLVIPSGVTRIEQSIVDYCDKLKTLEVLGTINYIDAWAFRGCVNLNTIKFLSVISPDAVSIYSRSGYPPLDNGTYEWGPFGNGLNDIVGTNGRLTNKNKFYLPYNHQGYTSEYVLMSGSTTAEGYAGGYATYERAVAARDKRSDKEHITIEEQSIVKKWYYPMFDSALSNFTIEYCPIDSYVVVDVYKDGARVTSGTLYAKSETGNFTASTTYNLITSAGEGFGLQFNNDAYSNEKIYLYEDASFSTLIGEFTLTYGITSYTSDGTTLSSSSSPMLLSAESEPENVEVSNNDNSEKADITKAEYLEMQAKINQLTSIINKMMS